MKMIWQHKYCKKLEDTGALILKNKDCARTKNAASQHIVPIQLQLQNAPTESMKPRLSRRDMKRGTLKAHLSLFISGAALIADVIGTWTVWAEQYAPKLLWNMIRIILRQNELQYSEQL